VDPDEKPDNGEDGDGDETPDGGDETIQTRGGASTATIVSAAVGGAILVLAGFLVRRRVANREAEDLGAAESGMNDSSAVPDHDVEGGAAAAAGGDESFQDVDFQDTEEED